MPLSRPIIELAVKGCRFRLSPHGPAYVRRHPGNARRTASAVAAYQRVMTRAASIGREETFLAAAQWTRICWLEGRTDWWRPALTQAKHPDLLVRYACQFLLRRAFRVWLRVTAAGPTAQTPLTATPLPAPESPPR